MFPGADLVSTGSAVGIRKCDEVTKSIFVPGSRYCEVFVGDLKCLAVVRIARFRIIRQPRAFDLHFQRTAIVQACGRQFRVHATESSFGLWRLRLGELILLANLGASQTKRYTSIVQLGIGTALDAVGHRR